jgi:hypothetical protein
MLSHLSSFSFKQASLSKRGTGGEFSFEYRRKLNENQTGYKDRRWVSPQRGNRMGNRGRNRETPDHEREKIQIIFPAEGLRPARQMGNMKLSVRNKRKSLRD